VSPPAAVGRALPSMCSAARAAPARRALRLFYLSGATPAVPFSLAAQRARGFVVRLSEPRRVESRTLETDNLGRQKPAFIFGAAH
jgi:hypothetical protein